MAKGAASIGTGSIAVNLDTSALDNPVAFNAKMNSLLSNVQRSMDVMFGNLAASVVQNSIALIAGFSDKFKDLEKSVIRYQVALASTNREFKEMAKLQDISFEIGNDLINSISVLKQLDLAAAKGGEELKNLELVLKTAEAGFADANTVAALSTAILRQYGIAASEMPGLLDKLHTSVARSGVSWEIYHDAISKVLPSARALKIPLDELLSVVTTAMRVSANESAGNQSILINFQRGLSQLLENTSDAKEALSGFGIEMDESSIKRDGLLKTIAKLNLLSEKEIQNITRSGNSLGALTLVAKNFNQVLEEQAALAKSSGSVVRDQAALTENTYSEHINDLITRFDILKTKIFESLVGPLNDALEILSKMARALKDYYDLLYGVKVPTPESDAANIKMLTDSWYGTMYEAGNYFVANYLRGIATLWELPANTLDVLDTGLFKDTSKPLENFSQVKSPIGKFLLDAAKPFQQEYALVQKLKNASPDYINQLLAVNGPPPSAPVTSGEVGASQKSIYEKFTESLVSMYNKYKPILISEGGGMIREGISKLQQQSKEFKDLADKRKLYEREIEELSLSATNNKYQAEVKSIKNLAEKEKEEVDRLFQEKINKLGKMEEAVFAQFSREREEIMQNIDRITELKIRNISREEVDPFSAFGEVSPIGFGITSDISGTGLFDEIKTQTKELKKIEKNTRNRAVVR